MLAILGYIILILVIVFVALRVAKSGINKSRLYFCWFLSVCVLLISGAVLYSSDYMQTKNKKGFSQNKEKTIKVGVVYNTLPYLVAEDNNGVLGLEANLIDAIAAKAGYSVIYINIKDTSPYEALSLGNVDLLAGNLTLDFIKDKNNLLASQDYLQAKIVAVTTNGNVDQYSTLTTMLSQFKGKTVGVDTTLPNFNNVMKNTLTKSKALIQTYSKPIDLLNDLNSNQLDLVFTSDLSLKFYKSYKQNNSLTSIRFSTPPQQLQTYNIVMVAQNQQLVNKLNESIVELKNNHKLEDIIQQYIDGNS